ncbi:MAG: hypothetical protein ACO3V2_08065, partial [Ilumatobacteraceae bacterium]
ASHSSLVSNQGGVVRVLQQVFMMKADSIARGSEAFAAMSSYWNEKAGLPGYTYSVTLGMPQGTSAVSIRADSMAAISAALWPMMADPEFQRLTNEVNACLASPAEAVMWQVLHAAGEMPPQPSTIVHQITLRTTDPGAIPWAVEIANHASSVIERPVVVAGTTYGSGLTGTPANSLTFFTYWDDPAQIDESGPKLMIDADYAALQRRSSGLIDPSFMSSVLARRSN